MKKTIISLFMIFSLFILCFSNIYASQKNFVANPKVSIIVPVYKVEKFLSQCLDSLINQTLKEIEIICINDGSPDRSIDILNKYRKIDKRIKVISQKNQGSSAARNRGIDESKGEYIKFVDADDILNSNACEICYQKAKEVNADILVHSYYCFNKNSKWVGSQFNDSLITKQRFNVFTYNVWSELYKSNLIKTNNIRFLDGIIKDEDWAFNMICFPKAKVIRTISNKLYNYRTDNYDSIVHSRAFATDSNHIKLMDAIFDDWFKNGYFSLNEAKVNFLNYGYNNSDNVKRVITNGNFNILQDGTYQIVSAIDNNKVIDIDNATSKICGNVQLWDKNETDAQKFEIKYNENGWYTIKAKCSNLMLDVEGASNKIGTNIQQYSSNDTNAQKWYIIPKANGYYNIISKCNNLYMDVSGAICKNGTNIQCWQGNNTNAQNFKFIK